MGKKSTKAEIEQRIHEVKGLLLSGYVRKDILAYAEKWEIKETSIDALIARAWDEISALNERDFEKNRNKVLTCLWKAYHQAQASSDKRTQVAALKVIGEFTGLHEISVRMNDERIDAPDIELEKAIEAEHVH